MRNKHLAAIRAAAEYLLHNAPLDERGTPFRGFPCPDLAEEKLGDILAALDQLEAPIPKRKRANASR